MCLSADDRFQSEHTADVDSVSLFWFCLLKEHLYTVRVEFVL